MPRSSLRRIHVLQPQIDEVTLERNPKSDGLRTSQCEELRRKANMKCTGFESWTMVSVLKHQSGSGLASRSGAVSNKLPYALCSYWNVQYSFVNLEGV